VLSGDISASLDCVIDNDKCPTNTFYISESGADFEYCGLEPYPCRNVDYVVKIVTSNGMIKIVPGNYSVKAIGLEGESLSDVAAFSIEGLYGETIVNENNESVIPVTTLTPVYSGESPTPWLKLRYSNVTISSITVVCVGGPGDWETVKQSYPLINVGVNTIFTLSKIDFVGKSNIDVVNNIIIRLDEESSISKVNITDCQFRNVSVSGCPIIYDASGCEIIISLSTFTNIITSNWYNGSILATSDVLLRRNVSIQSTNIRCDYMYIYIG
jgi:hypothetical protein